MGVTVAVFGHKAQSFPKALASGSGIHRDSLPQRPRPRKQSLCQ
jgi:hypothetical protein